LNERFNALVLVIFSLAHDPEKWEPVSRLRQARFGGAKQCRKDKDHARAKS
jgi:hypothetical protein